MRTDKPGRKSPRYQDPRSKYGSGRSTIKMAQAQADKIFDYVVQGFTLPQIATQLGVTRPAVSVVTSSADFRERVRQFNDARRDAIRQRLEAAGETAALSLLRVARGGERDETSGKFVPVDPRVAEVQIKASDSILDRVGFTKVARSTTTVVGAVRTGGDVSDEDMERLRALLGEAPAEARSDDDGPEV